jgi:hypothetical protein
MKNSTSKARLTLGSMAAVAFMVTAGAAIAANAEGSTTSASNTKPVQSAQVIPDVTIFEGTQQPADTLPDYLTRLQEDAAINLGSTRLLGENSTGSVWAALDTTNQVCVIVSIAAEPGVGSASCTSADRFNAQGLSVMTGTLTTAVEAYLLPDAGVPSSPSVASVEGSHSANLILGDPSVNDEATASRSSDRTAFPVVLLPNNIGADQ